MVELRTQPTKRTRRPLPRKNQYASMPAGPNIGRLPVTTWDLKAGDAASSDSRMLHSTGIREVAVRPWLRLPARYAQPDTRYLDLVGQTAAPQRMRPTANGSMATHSPTGLSAPHAARRWPSRQRPLLRPDQRPSASSQRPRPVLMIVGHLDSTPRPPCGGGPRSGLSLMPTQPGQGASGRRWRRPTLCPPRQDGPTSARSRPARRERRTGRRRCRPPPRGVACGARPAAPATSLEASRADANAAAAATSPGGSTTHRLGAA